MGRGGSRARGGAGAWVQPRAWGEEREGRGHGRNEGELHLPPPQAGAGVRSEVPSRPQRLRKLEGKWTRREGRELLVCPFALLPTPSCPPPSPAEAFGPSRQLCQCLAGSGPGQGEKQLPPLPVRTRVTRLGTAQHMARRSTLFRAELHRPTVPSRSLLSEAMEGELWSHDSN